MSNDPNRSGTNDCKLKARTAFYFAGAAGSFQVIGISNVVVIGFPS
jgi:hypothetical protein